MNRKRLSDLDNAKGLAIFLVVVGHIVATDMPQGNEWYAVLKMCLYKFHMPFFIFLSGMIMAHTFPDMGTMEKYFAYVWKKVRRLAPGFFIFGSIIYLGKSFASHYIYVDDIPGDIASEIFKLLVIPSESAGGSLWFIYVLMELYILFPLVILASKNRPAVVLVIGGILHFMPSTRYFLIDRLFEYSLYFGFGIYVIWNLERFLEFVDRFLVVFLCAFAASFMSIPYLPATASKLIIGSLSIPALLGLVRLASFPGESTWNLYGEYTYSIYLMNTIFIGLLKGFILIFTSWNGMNFLWIAPVLLISGLYGPILMKKHVFAKSAALDRLTS